MSFFSTKVSIFTDEKHLCILHGRVFENNTRGTTEGQLDFCILHGRVFENNTKCTTEGELEFSLLCTVEPQIGPYTNGSLGDKLKDA